MLGAQDALVKGIRPAKPLSQAADEPGTGLLVGWRHYNAMMIEAPKRRWFAYSLRTLFVVVTLFGCWLGWCIHTVNEQREMRQWIEKRGGEVRSGPSGIKSVGQWVIDGPRKPTLRNLDWRRTVRVRDYVAEIDVPGCVSEQDKARIKAVFPDATLYHEAPARFFGAPLNAVE